METSAKIRNAKSWMKYNKEKVAVIFYGFVALAMVLVSTIVYSEPVVPICFILLMETAIIALLNSAPMWVQGIFVVIQLVAGILMDRTAMVVLLTICYVVGTVALMYVKKGDLKHGKR